ncbi:MAG: GNAT family N-acetyltransferase, partial [Thioalkalispiraceae bacterium]
PLAKLTFLLRKWDDTQLHVTRLRKQVFMDEYNLPLNFLRHKDDAERYHVVAYEDRTGKPVATGCIHGDGHIGRIAILPEWRKTDSVAHVIVDDLVHLAKTLGLQHLWLNAPTGIMGYFIYHDFHPAGEPFEYCGLTMQKLELRLAVEKIRTTH